VMGFLCAVASSQGRLPQRAAPRAKQDASRGAGAVLLDLLRGDTHRPQWCARMAGQGAALQDAAAPLLLSVLVRRAADASDLARLSLVLSAALQYGLTDGPAPLQAAALLRRAQCLAEGLMRDGTAAPGLPAAQVNEAPLPSDNTWTG
jgi:hypothetical protein